MGTAGAGDKGLGRSASRLRWTGRDNGPAEDVDVAGYVDISRVAAGGSTP